jgi:hypothetical protein
MLFKEFRFVSRELKEFRDGREDKIKCFSRLDQFLAKYNLPEKFHILISHSIASQYFGMFPYLICVLKGLFLMLFTAR